MTMTSSAHSSLQMRTSSHPMKKVAVIGAGLAGLVTIKELLEENHAVVCFEQEDEIGGTFYSKKDKYGVYNDLHLTISNFFMSFSSLPPEDKKRRYWTGTEYLNYLHEFARVYSLRDYIRFNTVVQKIEPVDTETWRVTYLKDGETREEYVDAVAVCSGRFRQPKVPTFKGSETFKGKIHHSYKYKSPAEFAGKDVVCVGLGESGSDIVHQIAKVSRSAHLVVTRPKHIIPRIVYGGDTNDARTTRASHYSYLVSQSTFEATLKKRVLDQPLLRSGKLSPASMWRYLVTYGFHGEFSNKNDIFFQDIEHGRLQLHLFGIDHLYADGVVLTDGTRVPCTDLVLSTGYATNFDIIRHSAAREVAASVRNNLFHMIHPDLRETMAWIGFVRPDVGGVPAVAELQARYFAKLLAKKLHLPERDQLLRDIESLRDREEFHFCLEPNSGENVKYYNITNQIAEKLGVRATWTDLVRDPRLLLYYYHGSMVACQFRLVGPDSNRQQASAFIKKVGLLSGPSEYVLFLTTLTSALSALAPAVRKTFKLLGVEDGSAYDQKRYKRAADILARQWPWRFGGVSGDQTLRSLFSRAYEYEGFKYFLVHVYGLDPAFFVREGLTVADLDRTLASEGGQVLSPAQRRPAVPAQGRTTQMTLPAEG